MLDYRSSLGKALARLAQLRSKQGHATEACELYEQAIRQQKSAVAAAPWHLPFKQSLKHHYYNLAETRVSLKDAAGAARTAESLVHDLPESGWALALAAKWIDRCARLTRGDQSLTAEQRDEQARRYVTRARELIEQAAKLGSDDHLALGSLAWLLTTAFEPDLRDPSRAVALARSATTVAPQSAAHWGALGLACLRADDREGPRGDRPGDGSRGRRRRMGLAHPRLGSGPRWRLDRRPSAFRPGHGMEEVTYHRR